MAVANDQPGLFPDHRIPHRHRHRMVRLPAAGAAGQTVHRRLPAFAGGIVRAHAPPVPHLAHRLAAAIDGGTATAPVAPGAAAAGLARGPQRETERVGAGQSPARLSRSQQGRRGRQRAVQHRAEALALDQGQRRPGAGARRFVVGLARHQRVGRQVAVVAPPLRRRGHQLAQPVAVAQLGLQPQAGGLGHVVAIAGVVQAPVGLVPAVLALHQRVTQLVQHQLRQAVVGVQRLGRAHQDRAAAVGRRVRRLPPHHLEPAARGSRGPDVIDVGRVQRRQLGGSQTHDDGDQSTEMCRGIYGSSMAYARRQRSGSG